VEEVGSFWGSSRPYEEEEEEEKDREIRRERDRKREKEKNGHNHREDDGWDRVVRPGHIQNLNDLKY
jgi:hypothetical protein